MPLDVTHFLQPPLIVTFVPGVRFVVFWWAGILLCHVVEILLSDHVSLCVGEWSSKAENVIGLVMHLAQLATVDATVIVVLVSLSALTISGLSWGSEVLVKVVAIAGVKIVISIHTGVPPFDAARIGAIMIVETQMLASHDMLAFKAVVWDHTTVKAAVDSQRVVAVTPRRSTGIAGPIEERR